VEAISDFQPPQSLTEQDDIKSGTTGEVIAVEPGDLSDRVSIKFFRYHCPISGLRLFPRGKATWVDGADLEHLMIIDEPTVNLKPLIGALVITSLCVFGITNGKYLSAQLTRFVYWSKTLGWWSPVLIFAIASLLPVIMLPVFPLMALSGPLFTEMYDGNAVMGGLIAFVAVFGGLWLGSVIAFALGKTIFKDYAEKAGQESTTLKKLNRLIDTGGVRIVLMARALPILPAEVFDYACALTCLQVWQYAIGCLGSAIPVAFWTFSSAEAAAAAHDNISGNGGASAHLWLIVINVVALVALTLLLYYTITHQKHQQAGETGDVLLNTNPSIMYIRRTQSVMPSITSSMSTLPNNSVSFSSLPDVSSSRIMQANSAKYAPILE
jgi:uncharacterized membrane protein YdjX (TVP38/TMEM64 family)